MYQYVLLYICNLITYFFFLYIWEDSIKYLFSDFNCVEMYVQLEKNLSVNVGNTEMYIYIQYVGINLY